ncbi:DUF4493 domain-containing protein [Flammeovirga kamogawensis]|uniref:DUF4493 domain-containing protein n=1 Tax=Flammeovirga kamogawensis TaxID=373891 RepID=A0ABX8H3Y8_9BACT|nr:DUF4493 domain-containing protein [Flammeovirga kamogawensis]MBB6461875.1 hypothetical protein [Flammeovirga kamogawensis]QWG10511.1 DUF4493 domain-containing protein [Flammeovirga kamogawensis]TRX63620.1 DUF4493 domain-containing protein [Flammeovirga kamogawensis]
MKRNIYFLFVTVMIALLSSSCQQQEKENIEKGTVRLSDILVTNHMSNAKVTTTDGSDFRVELRTDPQIPGEYLGTVAEIEGKDMLLNVGAYYIYVASKELSDTFIAPSFTAAPYYDGVSEEVFVKAGVTYSASVICKIRNTKIGISYTDAYKTKYPTRSVTFTTASGESLVFSGDTETQFGLFDPRDGGYTAVVSATDVDNKTITQTFMIEQPQANEFYSISIQLPSSTSATLVKSIEKSTF